MANGNYVDYMSHKNAPFMPRSNMGTSLLQIKGLQEECGGFMQGPGRA